MGADAGLVEVADDGAVAFDAHDDVEVDEAVADLARQVVRARVRLQTGAMLQEGGFVSELTADETDRTWAGCVSGARPVDEALGMVGLGGRAGAGQPALRR